MGLSSASELPSRAAAASTSSKEPDHAGPQASPADFILRERPAAVVVETAVSPEHGAAVCATFSCDQIGWGQPWQVAEIACRASAALAKEPDVAASSMWKVRAGWTKCLPEAMVFRAVTLDQPQPLHLGNGGFSLAD